MSYTLPHSQEAEIYLLGELLQDPSAFLKISGIVRSAEEFFQERHQAIWKSISDLRNKNLPTDVVTLLASLEKNGNLALAGGRDYLLSLMESASSAANAEYHAEIVHEKYLLRRIIATSEETIKAAKDPQTNAKEQIEQTAAAFYHLVFGSEHKQLVPIADVIKDLLAESNDSASLLKTGFKELDAITGGLAKGDMVTLGGRTGHGKSIFAGTVARNVAMAGKTVAFFALEMRSQEIARRAICSIAQVDQNHFKTRTVDQHETAKLQDAINEMVPTRFYLDDSMDITIDQIFLKANALKAKQGLDLVVIDYLQLISTEHMGAKENQTTRVGKLSRSVKLIAKKLDVPVLVLSQFNRDLDKGDTRPPRLSDLKDSGSIEQDSDLVLFVDLPFRYNKKFYDYPTLAHLHVAKNRNGKLKVIDLSIFPEYTLIRNREKEPPILAPYERYEPEAKEASNG
jgi:replicative DNA helicase